MRKQSRKVIASVETCDESGSVDFRVADSRTITLTFPDAVLSYGGYGRLPFNRTLTPDEARAIGTELIEAADRVTSAQA